MGKKLFGEIKDGIGKCIKEKIGGNTKDWHTKTFFKFLLKNDKRIEEVSRYIVDTVEGKTKEFLERYKGETRESEKRGAFRKERRKAKYEEAMLERTLIASVGNLYNRFNFLSGITREKGTEKEDNAIIRNMTIDLVMTDKKGKIIRIIELKAWNSKDNPLSAIAEGLMYYFLYIGAKSSIDKLDELPEISEKVTISVLAPTEYYVYYGNKKDNQKFYSSIESNVEKLLRGKTLKFSEKEIKVSNKVGISFDEIKVSEGLVSCVSSGINGLRIIEDRFKESLSKE